MKYSEREAGITCDCGSHADAVMTACNIKPSLGGAHAGKMSKAKIPVGPLNPKTKAYQKKNDEANSKFYSPDQTFGQGSVKKYNELKVKQAQALHGKSDFTKNK